MKNKFLILGLVVSLLPGTIFAYTRPNNFMNLKGASRIAEIKKFQATLNVPVTGRIDDNTKKVLYNENVRVRDYVKAPTDGNWIVVNKSKRILTMYTGDKVKYKFPVAVGTSKTPTPSAIGKIKNKHMNPAWGGMGGKYKPTSSDDPKNPLGERWMGLNLQNFSGYGIHGTIKPHEIGRYVSNGCVRMFNYDIENYIFPNSKVGMPVYLGTDEELNSWGIAQYFEFIDKNTEAQVQNSNDKNVGTEKEKEKEYVSGELLEY